MKKKKKLTEFHCKCDAVMNNFPLNLLKKGNIFRFASMIFLFCAQSFISFALQSFSMHFKRWENLTQWKKKMNKKSHCTTWKMPLTLRLVGRSVSILPLTWVYSLLWCFLFVLFFLSMALFSKWAAQNRALNCLHQRASANPLIFLCASLVFSPFQRRHNVDRNQ